MGLRKFPKIIKATKKTLPIGNLEKTKIPTGALETPISAEELALRQKQDDLNFLKERGIEPGSVEQLQFPETFASTIADPNLADWATKKGRELQLIRLAEQNALKSATASKLLDQPKRPKILTKEEMRKKREEDAAIQQVKERKQKEFEEGKTEGVRDIDLSKLKTTAAIGGAAIGAGMLASSLNPNEAEAGVRGSVLPRKLLSEKYGGTINRWTGTGAQGARQALQNVFEEDPSGLARKEMFRRLAKEGKITWNPDLQEHQIRLYRGDNPEFSENKLYEDVATSWTPDPLIAQGFGTMRGKIYQADVPLSKVGSFLNVLPGKRDYREEKEVITKPFKTALKEMEQPSSSLLDTTNKRMNENIPISQLAQKKYGAEAAELASSEANLRKEYQNLLESNPISDKFQTFKDVTPEMSNDDIVKYFKSQFHTEDPLQMVSLLNEYNGPFFDQVDSKRKKLLADSILSGQDVNSLLLKKLEQVKEGVTDADHLASRKRYFSNILNGLESFNVISKQEKQSFLNDLVTQHRPPKLSSFFAQTPDYKQSAYISSDPKIKNIILQAHEDDLLQKLDNLEITRTEYVKHLKQLLTDFGEFKPSRTKEAAAIGGAAIGAGMLANTPSAHAAEGPTVSQSNPEHSSSTTSNKVKDAVAEAEQKYGTYDLAGGIEKALEAPNKYILDPVKRNALAALKGQQVSEEEEPGFSDVYKQAMENAGKKNIGKFLKTFAAGASEDPTGITQEAIQVADEEKMADAIANTAGVATEVAVDPTFPLTAGASALRKGMRFFPKVRGLVK